MTKALSLLARSLLTAYLSLQPVDVKAEDYVRKAKKLIEQGACEDAVYTLKNTNALTKDPVEGNVALAKAYSCELKEGFSNAVLNGNAGALRKYSSKEKDLEKVLHDLSLLDDDINIQSLSSNLGYLVYNGKAPKNKSFNTPLDAAKTFVYSLLNSDDGLLHESKSRAFLESENRDKERINKFLLSYKRTLENPKTNIYFVLAKNASEARVFRQFGNGHVVYSIMTGNGGLGEFVLIMDKEGNKYKVSNIQ